MKPLGIAVALFGLVEIGVGIASHQPPVFLLAAFTLLAALTTFRSVGISTFLQVLIAYFSVETIVLGICVCLNALRLWPPALDEVHVPSTVAMTVALFSIISYLTSHMAVARKTLAITDRYFRADDPVVVPLGVGGLRLRERTLAAATIMFIILLNQLEVWFVVLFSYASSDISNAIQNYDAKAFWHALLVEVPLYLTPLLIANIIEFLAANWLFIRWRRWLTEDYSSRWLDRHNHYGMMLAGIGTDNPDQRIQEDIPRFINGGQFGNLGVYSFSIQLIAQLSSLVSFAIILWALSSKLTIPGTSFHIPGLLLWSAIIYAVLGTGLTAVIGRPLAQLAFARQHFEANFRFGLARLREYSEQIALLYGEMTERSILAKQFTSIIRNFYSIMFVKAFLELFITFFSYINEFIPYIIMAPFYFTRVVTLGMLTQARIAFGQVNSSLTFFVNYYSSLAEFKSVLDRLTTFDAALAAVPPAVPLVRSPSVAPGDFVLSHMQVRLPDGKLLSDPIDVRFAANENVLLTGPSGTGKSTLFRAISGVWPYVDGTVEVPSDASIMVLPQKPYLPVGTLNGVICYPREAGAYPETELMAILDAVELGQLKGLLDIDDHWTQRLSGGEQQRIAIARAMLAKPTWLLLDEATASMDVDLERRIYKSIATYLPGTTVISIGHRESLADQHARRLSVKAGADGLFTLTDQTVAAE